MLWPAAKRRPARSQPVGTSRSEAINAGQFFVALANLLLTFTLQKNASDPYNELSCSVVLFIQCKLAACSHRMCTQVSTGNNPLIPLAINSTAITARISSMIRVKMLITVAANLTTTVSAIDAPGRRFLMQARRPQCAQWWAP